MFIRQTVYNTHIGYNSLKLQVDNNKIRTKLENYFFLVNTTMTEYLLPVRFTVYRILNQFDLDSIFLRTNTHILSNLTSYAPMDRFYVTVFSNMFVTCYLNK